MNDELSSDSDDLPSINGNESGNRNNQQQQVGGATQRVVLNENQVRNCLLICTIELIDN